MALGWIPNGAFGAGLPTPPKQPTEGLLFDSNVLPYIVLPNRI